MALIGNGAQSEFQAIAFHTLLGIDEIRVFDVDPHATDKLVQNLAAYPRCAWCARVDRRRRARRRHRDDRHRRQGVRDDRHGRHDRPACT